MRRERTGERSKELERSSLGSSGGNDDRVLHSIILLKGLDKLSDGGTLLTDGSVDTVQLLGLVLTIVPTLLVEDGVEGNGSLAGLTITDDQLTLTTTNGNHGVNGLHTGLHRLVDRLAGQNTRSLDLGTASLLGVDGSLAIDGVTKSVDDTTKHLRADRNVNLFDS
jgi:hypothetical protein